MRPAREYRFEQHRRAEIVGADVALDLVHRLAHPNLGCFVKNYVDMFERFIDKLSIANVTLKKFDCGI